MRGEKNRKEDAWKVAQWKEREKGCTNDKGTRRNMEGAVRGGTEDVKMQIERWKI